MQSDGFGPYVLEAPLGRAGVGEVHRAVDTEHDRVVELEVLPESLSAHAGYRERFSAAAARAARLDDPHVVPVVRSGEVDGRLFLERPVHSGRDLATVLADEGPLDPARAVAVVTGTARALDAASAADLVHPDLGPSAVLLPDGGEDGERALLTGLGAPPPPGRERAHVPALAGLLHACLTGEHPPAGAPAEPPSALRPELPAELDEVVRRGLSDDPAERYATCGELAAAADAALRDTDDSGGVGRLQLLLGAVAALAVLAVVLVLVLAGGDDAPADAASTPTTAPPVTSTPAPPRVDPAQERLRALVPDNFIAVDCDPGEPTPDGALAVLGCGSAQNQPGPEDSMFYLYASPAAADAAFLADMERNGVAPLPAGAQCPGTQGHGVYTRDGDRSGRFACWIDEDDDAIWAWTQDDVPVEGLVLMVDGGMFGLDALNTWWNARELSEFLPR